MILRDIALLQQTVERLIKANLLVLDKEISLFLSQIAENEVFRNIIMESNKNYSFQEDWQKFLFQKKITLPLNKRDRIAFVLGLLYKLDIKEMSSIDMLMTFYAENNDLQASYYKFCDQILYPFQEAFTSLLKGEPVSEDDTSAQPIPVLDKMAEDINEWVQLLIQKVITSSKKLDEKTEKEVHFMIKGFSDNLDSKDYTIIKLLWTGLKNTFHKYNLKYKETEQIEKLFHIYGMNMEI